MNKINRAPFPYIATLVAFTAVVIMLGLGFWQLERKAEKDQRIAHIAVAQAQQSISLADLIDDPEDYQDYTVLVDGEFSNEAFFIDNKLLNGKAGFHVLLPLQTNLGTVMANLGWIQGTGVRSELPVFEFPKPDADNANGKFIKVQGIVYLPLKNALITETNKEYGEFPALLQQVDLQQISRHLDKPVLPFVVRILPDNSSEFVRDWKVITMSPEKHLGYAVQWFGLAIAAITIYLLSLLKRMHAPHAKNDDRPQTSNKN